MIEFHPISIDDFAWAAPIMRSSNYMCCGYSFVTQFMWSHAYNTHIAKYDDWVLIRSDVGDTCYYLWPAGKGGDERKAIETMERDAERIGRPMYLYSVTLEAKTRLEEWYPGKFTITSDRADYDYIYEQANLAELPGRRFQKKRNHVSRFIRENPDWQFHPLTKEDLPAIRAFNDAWSQLYENKDNPGIQTEHSSIELLFDNFDKLDLRGGYVTAGGRIVAFSFGSPINDRVFDTHVEKALYDVTGAYNIINREMARNVCAGFDLINREDDVGDEGLRAAKLSYNPDIIEPKYLAALNK
ncbi:DUF2156 domain-containing protein [Candidatus Allofournierella merdipullorum]|uniref:DUF2156 domain-containing protein n=1 Tax=Candidatus Allofournierella merdipullorum TaxID=2838595 RepID=UPI003AB1EA17